MVQKFRRRFGLVADIYRIGRMPLQGANETPVFRNCEALLFTAVDHGTNQLHVKIVTRFPGGQNQFAQISPAFAAQRLANFAWVVAQHIAEEFAGFSKLFFHDIALGVPVLD